MDFHSSLAAANARLIIFNERTIEILPGLPYVLAGAVRLPPSPVSAWVENYDLTRVSIHDSVSIGYGL